MQCICTISKGSRKLVISRSEGKIVKVTRNQQILLQTEAFWVVWTQKFFSERYRDKLKSVLSRYGHTRPSYSRFVTSEMNHENDIFLTKLLKFCFESGCSKFCIRIFFFIFLYLFIFSLFACISV